MKYENALVGHYPQVDEVQNFPNNFDLGPMTFTLTFFYLDPRNLDLRPLTLTPVTLTLDTFSDTRLKTDFSYFWPLTYDLELQTRPRYDGP